MYSSLVSDIFDEKQFDEKARHNHNVKLRYLELILYVDIVVNFCLVALSY